MDPTPKCDFRALSNVCAWRIAADGRDDLRLRVAGLLGSVPVAVIHSFFVEHDPAGPAVASRVPRREAARLPCRCSHQSLVGLARHRGVRGPQASDPLGPVIMIDAAAP